MKRINYATQFLDAVRTNPDTKRMLSFDPDASEALERLLLRSQKFILPDKGHLLYGPKGLPQHVEINRLPYPVIAIETTWEYPTDAAYLAARAASGLNDANASKRIALAFEVESPAKGMIGTIGGVLSLPSTSILYEAANEWERFEKPTGYVVVPIFYADEQRCWSANSGCIYVPYDQDTSASGVHLYSDIVINAPGRKELLKAEGIKIEANQKKTLSQPVVILPNLFKVAASMQPFDKTLQQIVWDAGEEARMIVELTMALSCSNVGTTTDTPSKLLQKQRTAKKKPPLFDYHILTINGQSIDPDKPHQGGSHASPRTHLRRGHLRRLPGRDERIWINDTIVNPGNGFLGKDYSLTR